MTGAEKSTIAYSIENVTREEYETLIEVWERSVRATHYFLSEDDIVFYRKLILEQYFDLVDLFCVRSVDGKIIAFLGTSKHKIEMLFVDPFYRGQGAGKTLVRYAVQHLHIRSVDVNEQNTQAVAFYKALGFYAVNRMPVDGMGKPYPVLQLLYAH